MMHICADPVKLQLTVLVPVLLLPRQPLSLLHALHGSVQKDFISTAGVCIIQWINEHGQGCICGSSANVAEGNNW